jgi:putative ABC transport system permease protein
VIVKSTSSAQVGDRQVTASADVERKGSLAWTLLEGRLPAGANEVAVGARLAADTDTSVGDTLTLTTARGERMQFVVVGTGLGPTTEGQALGSDLLLSPAGLAQVQHEQPFREAYVKGSSEAGTRALRAELGREVEVFDREQPPEIHNLTQLERLPRALGLCLAALAALALAHALVVAVRRRARDLAVVRAIGFTSTQSAGAVATMATTTALVGVLVGIPLGMATGSVVWRAVANSAYVADDVRLPLLAIAIVVPAAIAGAVLIAAMPARRAARLSPSVLLRSE